MSPVRMHFWQSHSRLPAGCASPSRYGTSGCIPAVVNRTVGSFWGISELPEMIACPCDSKNFRYISLSSSALMLNHSSGNNYPKIDPDSTESVLVVIRAIRVQEGL